MQEWTGALWEVRVIPLRNGKPAGKGSSLWRRQHRDGGQDVYRWADPWGVFDSVAVHRLAAALIVNALDVPEKARSYVTRRSDLAHIAAHLTGDVLVPLAGTDGDRAWALDSSEITAWLELHGFLGSSEESV